MRISVPLVSLVLACLSCAPPPAAPAAPPPPVEPKPQATVAPPPPQAVVEDPNLWLEDVSSDKSLAWVRERNKASQGELEALPGFGALRDRIRGILASKEKMPYVTKRGPFYYNFWEDDEHVRGLIRRTTLAEYKKAKPAWETVLDLDAINAAEHESWVFKGQHCLYPKYERCLVELSRGGGDSIVVREFDAVKKQFVAGGYVLPEGKSSSRVEGLRHGLRRRGLRPRNADDVGLPARRQGVEAGHAARRRQGRSSRVRRATSAVGGRRARGITARPTTSCSARSRPSRAKRSRSAATAS